MTGVSIHNSVGVVCPRLSLQHFRQPLAFGVGVVPEVEEEEQENQAIQADDVDEDRELVGAVLHEEILGDVAGHHNKLDLGSNRERKGSVYCQDIHKKKKKKCVSDHFAYQLNGSEVFLPPQVLLVAGPHRSKPVVRVHDNMDDTVEQGVEGPQTT